MYKCESGRTLDPDRRRIVRSETRFEKSRSRSRRIYHISRVILITTTPSSEIASTWRYDVIVNANATSPAILVRSELRHPMALLFNHLRSVTFCMISTWRIKSRRCDAEMRKMLDLMSATCGKKESGVNANLAHWKRHSRPHPIFIF